VGLTSDMARGVVSLPHGWGHGREGAALAVAAAHAGASLNDLTDEQSIDVLSGNAAFSGVSVTVSKARPAPLRRIDQLSPRPSWIHPRQCGHQLPSARWPCMPLDSGTPYVTQRANSSPPRALDRRRRLN